jgi:hypothetical protein
MLRLRGVTPYAGSLYGKKKEKNLKIMAVPKVGMFLISPN